MKWLLIATFLLIIFLSSQLLKYHFKNKIKPSTKLLFSFAWFIVTMTTFLIFDLENKNFTSFQQITLIVFAFVGLIYFYLRIKKLIRPT